jgi:SAM-dependent methyltransferase
MASRFNLGLGSRVCDLGCGPGLYANLLAARGASVTGVDFSKNSLAHARSVAAESGLEVEYRRANYLELELDETFDLVLLIFADFCPLGPGQRRALLNNVKKWLAPGGRFVFDVASTALFETVKESTSYDSAPEGGFWSPGPHFVLQHKFRYPEESVFLDRYAVIEEDRYRELYNWMQCFDAKGLEAELGETGWDVEATFGNVAGDPFDAEGDFFAVVAGAG